MKFSREMFCRVLLTVLLIQWSGLPSIAAAQQQSSNPITVIEAPAPVELKLAELSAQPGESNSQQLAAKLEKLFAALDEAQKQIPRETFDPNVIIDGQPEVEFAGVGGDPVKLFEWVRDNTYLVPYRGVLRDHMGVLMDRVGNSLDRALLLFSLLRHAGHKKVRLAYAELSDEEATELLEKARPMPEKGALPRPQVSPDELATQLEHYARKYDLDPAELRQVIDEMTLKSQRLAEEAVQRTVEQSQLLIEMLREKDLVPSREEQMERLRADAVKAFKHHWWVQWQSDQGGGGIFGGSAGKTIDLDPSLPNAEPGKTLVEMQKIVPGNELTERLQNEMHTVQIRLIIERWENGKLVELPVLTQRLFPANFIGERIAIHHAPAPGNWPEDLNLFEEEKPLARLKDVVLGQREWIPVLSVGEHRISKYGFTDEGEITDPTLPGFVQSALAGKELVKGMEQGVEVLGERVFGQLARVSKYDPGPSRPLETNKQLKTDKPSRRSQLTAEWIEYEIHIPGEETQVIRRQIFDLVGPAVRAAAHQAAQDDAGAPAPELNKQPRLNRGLALLGQTEILPTVGHFSPEYAARLQMQNLRANRELLLSLLRTPSKKSLSALTEQGTKLTPIAGRLYAFALSRYVWALRRGDVYLDQPNIFSFHEYLRNNSRNQLVVGEAFDIVTNRVAIRPRSSANAFVVRLEQGVVDANVEALLARDMCKLTTDKTDCAVTDSVAHAFAKSLSQDISWLAIQRIDNLSWASIKLTDDLRSSIDRQLRSGHIVIAPKGQVLVEGQAIIGWWRVDRKTGTTLGIGARGWGQTSTEQQQTEKDVAAFFKITTAIAVIFNICTIAKSMTGKIPRDVGNDPAKKKQEDRELLGCALLALTGGPGLFIPFPYNIPLLGAGIAADVYL